MDRETARIRRKIQNYEDINEQFVDIVRNKEGETYYHNRGYISNHIWW